MARSSAPPQEDEDEESEEEEEEEEEEEWVPFRERREWADVVPVPQNDGPRPVVPIAYSDQFREVMDYFRAVLASDERSPRSLKLTQEAILLNPGNYTAWHFRRLVLEALSMDILEELKFVEKVAKSNYKNYQIWHHRRWASQKLGVASVPNELKFTQKTLFEDAKNYHAWSHRQWVLQALGGWEGELDYCHTLIEQDHFNNSAWNQRYFVIKNSPLLGGIKSMRESEVSYSIGAILLDPSNESPWRYLRGLFKGDDEELVKSSAVEKVLCQVLAQNRSAVFALDLLLDLLCLGFKPPLKLLSLLQLDADPTTPSMIAKSICARLKETDSMRALYWDWRNATIPIPEDSQ